MRSDNSRKCFDIKFLWPSSSSYFSLMMKYCLCKSLSSSVSPSANLSLSHSLSITTPLFLCLTISGPLSLHLSLSLCIWQLFPTWLSPQFLISTILSLYHSLSIPHSMSVSLSHTHTLSLTVSLSLSFSIPLFHLVSSESMMILVPSLLDYDIYHRQRAKPH